MPDSPSTATTEPPRSSGRELRELLLSSNGALTLGGGSSLSLPLGGGEHGVGALNLYSRRPHAFGPRAQAEAKRFADEASRALNLAVRMAHQVEISAQLRAALASRTVIDQSIGILMGQNGCDADAAFAAVRSASQNRNVRLRTVAAEIITAVSSTPPADGYSSRPDGGLPPRTIETS